MKTIALLSGGKDSILALLMAYRYGHQPAVIVNIIPAIRGDSEDKTDDHSADAADVVEGHEIDSYMYQTVGFEAVEGIAACLQVPLRRARVQRGRAKDQSLLYSEQPPEEDEVESLYRLLKEVKAEFSEVQGITSGAILSNYQRNRVEFICDRLGMESLAYLWMRQPEEILDMAHALRVTAILVKTASIGLVPRQLLGKTLEAVRPTLEKMTALYQSHLAGEGGEYETTVLNCPLFLEEQLAVTGLEVVMQDDNDISPSGHALLTVAREAKTAEEQASDVALLQQLREGDLHFPSDVMPLLRRLPSSPPAQLPAERSCGGDVDDSAARVAPLFAFSLLSGAVRPGVTGHAFSGPLPQSPPSTTDSNEGAAAVVQRVVASRLQEAHEWAAVQQVTPFYYHISIPHSSYEPTVRATYAAAVSHVCPPGLLVTVAAAREGDGGAVKSVVVVVEVLAASCKTIQKDVLHAQSRSCWALGECGPFAQGRRVGLSGDGDALVFVSATPGRVPATRAVATAQDLPGPTCLPNLLGLMEGCVNATVAADIAAEFVFALANCECYLALFRRTLADVTRATLLVTDEVPLSLQPLLWRWCIGAAAVPFAEVCTVAVVGGLSAGERIRISLECAEIAEE